MYQVDEQDQVIELKDVPQSSVGAPMPIVVAGEHEVFLTYYLQDTPEDWDGTWVRLVDADSAGEPVAVVKFQSCCAHMFGPPNDEAFHGHPLAARGLAPYGVFEVQHSSWIRRLEQMNAVHPSHDKQRFMQDKRHFVFSFHDSTFECIAHGFEFEVATGSVKSVAALLLESVT